MARTVTYLGVKCKTKNCEYVIELGPLREIAGRSVEFPVIAEPMKIRCSQCEETHEYQNSDTIHFERQIP
jgi:hypothetical protein